MQINADIRAILPAHSFEFDELEKHCVELQSRFYSRTISHSQHRRPLGANCVNFLLSALVRTISLLEALAVSLNNKNVLASFLIVRAHYEITGAFAFFLKGLHQFNNGVIDETEFSDYLRTMSLGMKKLPDKSHPRYSRVPLIKNVLDYVDEADNFMKISLPKIKKGVLRANYDFLSEFCHPNAFGLALGRTVKGRAIEYERSPRLSTKYLTILLSQIRPSTSLFLLLFDESWKLVTESFEIPELQR